MEIEENLVKCIMFFFVVVVEAAGAPPCSAYVVMSLP